ncbi:Retrovirus-related Pol polyprotein from transposon gypsy, partial [Trichinella sp. T6]
LDLASGYWQVEVAEEDREKTAFSTPLGLFQFRVMTFGLSSAPATFQRLMEKALKGLMWKTPEKCQVMRRSVHYLRHVVTQHGIGTDPEKTAAVQKWPTLGCVKEDRQFLGLAFYYKRIKVALGAEGGGGVHSPEKGAGQPLDPRPPRFRPNFPPRCGRQQRRRLSNAVSIRWLRNFREPEGHVARWLERLAEFDFDMVHRAVRKHLNADALSRHVCKQCGLEGSPAEKWRESDKDLQQIREWSTQRTWPQVAPEGDHMPEVGDPRYGRITAAAGHTEAKDPGDPGRRPQPAVRGPLGSGEEAGKVASAILLAPATGRRRRLVPGVPDVGSTSGPDKEALGTHATPAEGTRNGNRYILVLCDYFSNWPEAFALPNAEARTVAGALVNGLFCRYGSPETLHSDQAYHPQSDEFSLLIGPALITPLALPPAESSSDERCVSQWAWCMACRRAQQRNQSGSTLGVCDRTWSSSTKRSGEGQAASNGARSVDASPRKDQVGSVLGWPVRSPEETGREYVPSEGDEGEREGARGRQRERRKTRRPAWLQDFIQTQEVSTGRALHEGESSAADMDRVNEISPESARQKGREIWRSIPARRQIAMDAPITLWKERTSLLEAEARYTAMLQYHMDETKGDVLSALEVEETDDYDTLKSTLLRVFGCATFDDGSGIHQRTTQWLPLLFTLTEKIDVTCWFDRLEAFFKVARIPDCEKSTVVFMYVNETSHGLTHETDYNVLKDSLLNQLRVDANHFERHMELSRSTQTPEENVESYSARLVSLSKQAFSTAGEEVQTQMAKDQLIRGVSNDRIRELLVPVEEKPLAEMLKLAGQVETVLNRMRSAIGGATVVHVKDRVATGKQCVGVAKSGSTATAAENRAATALEEEEAQVSEALAVSVHCRQDIEKLVNELCKMLTQSVQLKQPQTRTANPPYQRLAEAVCWKCGSSSHYRRSCPFSKTRRERRSPSTTGE